MPKKNYHVITIRKNTFEKLVKIRKYLIEKGILPPVASYSDVIDVIVDTNDKIISDLKEMIE